MAPKTAIVTGASSGVGRGTAIALSAAGWNVVITARRLAELEETHKRCGTPDNCLIVAGEITDETFVKTLFEKAVEKFGRIDLLFNNAGISSAQVSIEEVSLETFQRVVNVNLVAPWLCTREAFKVFKAQNPQGGRIINNGSISAQVPRPFSSPYTSSKHALLGLTKSTALDGRKYGITCTQLDIGNTLSELVVAAGLAQSALQANGTRVPEACMEVSDVVKSIVHIAELPAEVEVLQMTILHGKTPFVGRG